MGVGSSPVLSNIPVFLPFWLLILYYVARSNYVAKIQVQDQCQIFLLRSPTLHWWILKYFLHLGRSVQY